MEGRLGCSLIHQTWLLAPELSPDQAGPFLSNSELSRGAGAPLQVGSDNPLWQGPHCGRPDPEEGRPPGWGPRQKEENV